MHYWAKTSSKYFDILKDLVLEKQGNDWNLLMLIANKYDHSKHSVIYNIMYILVDVIRMDYNHVGSDGYSIYHILPKRPGGILLLSEILQDLKGQSMLADFSQGVEYKDTALHSVVASGLRDGNFDTFEVDYRFVISYMRDRGILLFVNSEEDTPLHEALSLYLHTIKSKDVILEERVSKIIGMLVKSWQELQLYTENTVGFNPADYEFMLQSKGIIPWHVVRKEAEQGDLDFLRAVADIKEPSRKNTQKVLDSYEKKGVNIASAVDGLGKNAIFFLVDACGSYGRNFGFALGELMERGVPLKADYYGFSPFMHAVTKPTVLAFSQLAKLQNAGTFLGSDKDMEGNNLLQMAIKNFPFPKAGQHSLYRNIKLFSDVLNKHDVNACGRNLLGENSFHIAAKRSDVLSIWALISSDAAKCPPHDWTDNRGVTALYLTVSHVVTVPGEYNKFDDNRKQGVFKDVYQSLSSTGKDEIKLALQEANNVISRRIYKLLTGEKLNEQVSVQVVGREEIKEEYFWLIRDVEFDWAQLKAFVAQYNNKCEEQNAWLLDATSDGDNVLHLLAKMTFHGNTHRIVNNVIGDIIQHHMHNNLMINNNARQNPCIIAATTGKCTVLSGFIRYMDILLVNKDIDASTSTFIQSVSDSRGYNLLWLLTESVEDSERTPNSYNTAISNLLGNKVDIFFKNSEGWTVFHLAASRVEVIHGLLLRTLLKHAVGKIQEALASGFSWKDNNDETPLDILLHGDKIHSFLAKPLYYQVLEMVGLMKEVHIDIPQHVGTLAFQENSEDRLFMVTRWKQIIGDLDIGNNEGEGENQAFPSEDIVTTDEEMVFDSLLELSTRMKGIGDRDLVFSDTDRIDMNSIGVMDITYMTFAHMFNLSREDGGINKDSVLWRAELEHYIDRELNEVGDTMLHLVARKLYELRDDNGSQHQYKQAALLLLVLGSSPVLENHDGKTAGELAHLPNMFCDDTDGVQYDHNYTSHDFNNIALANYVANMTAQVYSTNMLPFWIYTGCMVSKALSSVSRFIGKIIDKVSSSIYSHFMFTDDGDNTCIQQRDVVNDIDSLHQKVLDNIISTIGDNIKEWSSGDISPELSSWLHCVDCDHLQWHHHTQDNLLIGNEE